MKTIYNVTVNDQYHFSLTEEEVIALDAVSSNTETIHILKNAKAFKALVKNSDFLKREYLINVNNTSYSIVISNALDQQIKAMGLSAGTQKNIDEIKAPMPGLILDVLVTPDQEVEENETLIILEAMKMENSIGAPRKGVIKSVSVSKGDAVEKNHLLIEFEKE